MVLITKYKNFYGSILCFTKQRTAQLLVSKSTSSHFNTQHQIMWAANVPICAPNRVLFLKWGIVRRIVGELLSWGGRKPFHHWPTTKNFLLFKACYLDAAAYRRRHNMCALSLHTDAWIETLRETAFSHFRWHTRPTCHLHLFEWQCAMCRCTWLPKGTEDDTLISLIIVAPTTHLFIIKRLTTASLLLVPGLSNI